MAALGAPILVDASYGEGGGALIRAALSFSALTQQPFRAIGARGAQRFTGLTAEDVTLIRALAALCDAESTGVAIGAHDFSFLPTRRLKSLSRPIEYLGSPDPHGSVCAPIVLNALLPLLARTGAYSDVGAQGETHLNGALTYDYFAHVTLGAYKRLGVYAYADLLSAGYGRGSCGAVRLEVEPSAIRGVEWESRGRLIAVRAVVATSNLPASVPARAASHLQRLAQGAKLPLEIELVEPRSDTPGAHITVWAEFESGIGGASCLGQKGLRMEAVAQSAFDQFFEWYRTEAPLDAFLLDQIAVALAISETDSVFRTSRITQRLTTTIWVMKQFLPLRATILGHENEPGTITIKKI